MSIDAPDYGQGFLGGAGTAAAPPVDWTAQELVVLGEVVRDSLRKAARRAVRAYLRGSVGRKEAELLVLGALATVATEMMGDNG